MSPNAVVSGSLAEIKFIKTRSVCVLCIELPIEQAEDAISKFGIPLPGQEIPVAVARLYEPVAAPVKAPDPDKSQRGKDAYAAKDAMEKAVVRAALICRDEAFQAYAGAATEVQARAELCKWLGVASRREIGRSELVYRNFLNIEHGFAISQGREPEPR
jgi:hypothetical protein